MSALNRIECPSCGGEVLVLRGAANRRWICCHCQEIIDLDVLEGRPRDEHAEPDAVEWEPLPTAHAAPTRAGQRSPYQPPPADADQLAESALRRKQVIKESKQPRLFRVLAVVFTVLAFVFVLYPVRLDDESILPRLDWMLELQRLGVLRAGMFGLFMAASFGIDRGRPWAIAVSVIALALGCVAFGFHPVPVAVALVLLPPLLLGRRNIRISHFATFGNRQGP